MREISHRHLTPDIQRRYDELKVRRDAGTLTDEERMELIRLSDQIEENDAQRLEHLLELARRRGTSSEQLLVELEIQAAPISSGSYEVFGV